MKIRTIKGVLEYVLKVLENEKSDIGYICNEIGTACGDEIISEELELTTLKYFKSQRPTRELHKEFFDNPYCFDGASWWSAHEYGNDRQPLRFKGANREDEMNERRRFLEYLIKTL